MNYEIKEMLLALEKDGAPSFGIGHILLHEVGKFCFLSSTVLLQQ